MLPRNQKSKKPRTATRSLHSLWPPTENIKTPTEEIEEVDYHNVVCWLGLADIVETLRR